MTPLLLSVKDVAAALAVSPWVVRHYIASGKLPHVELPSTKYKGEPNRRVLVAAKDLDAFIAKGTRRER